MPAPALLLLLGLGAAAVAAASSKHGPAPSSGSFELDAALPDPIKAQVLSAIGTSVDPNALEALAAQLDVQGWHLTAKALRARAAELRAHPPAIAAPPVPGLPPHEHHWHGPHGAPQPGPLPLPAPGSPPMVPLPVPPPASSDGLDPNIDPQTRQAVLVALATENDPAKLHWFASGIAAQYPIAAHLLEAKRLVILQSQPPPAPPSRASAEIRDVQHALNMLHTPGTPLAEDGINGPRTVAAVRAFQQAHGLKVDGIAGPQTHAALTAALSGEPPAAGVPVSAPAPAPVVPIRPGPSRVSAELRDVQHALNMLHTPGTPLAEDGINGPRTVAAVRAFQQAHGLKVDGIAGPQTHAALTAALSGEPPAVVPLTALDGVIAHQTIGPPPPGHPAAHPAAHPDPYVAAATVRDVQHGLNVLASAGLKEDGINGPATQAAVRAFQAAHGLPSDGIAGPQTRAALTQALARLPPLPSSGPPVVLTHAAIAQHPAAVPAAAHSPAAMGLRDVQHGLNVLHVPGTPIAEDGKNGPHTAAAVRAFQQAHGLAADGIVGPQTRAALTQALGGTPPLAIPTSLMHGAVNA